MFFLMQTSPGARGPGDGPLLPLHNKHIPISINHPAQQPAPSQNSCSELARQRHLSPFFVTLVWGIRSKFVLGFFPNYIVLNRKENFLACSLPLPLSVFWSTKLKPKTNKHQQNKDTTIWEAHKILITPIDRTAASTHPPSSVRHISPLPTWLYSEKRCAGNMSWTASPFIVKKDCLWSGFYFICRWLVNTNVL